MSMSERTRGRQSERVCVRPAVRALDPIEAELTFVLQQRALPDWELRNMRHRCGILSMPQPV
jgi:hypothetical protein